MRDRLILAPLILLALCPPSAIADNSDIELGGHLKTNILFQQFPPSSVFHAESGSHSLDATANLRLTAKASSGRWSFNADYQLLGAHLDTVGGPLLFRSGLPDDSRRWFDLTHSLDESGSTRAVHRLDRLWIGYTTPNSVVRFGRLALSWGNGLFYSPMDIVNPFDPVAVDTEYKVGDDLLYAQRLLPSGDDVEAAWVIRRSPVSGDVESGEATTALRYNAYRDNREYQLLVARSYGDTQLGAGGSFSVGGAVWRADLLLSDANGWHGQLVTNVSHSWVWRGHNVIGSLEYYFNGFGLHGKGYDLADVSADAQLLEKLARREAFNVGRHYLAAGLSLELSPLWLVSPAVFVNAEDRSALLQISSQYSLGDNLTLLGALTLPLGPEGREFRGIRNTAGNNYLSRDGSLFAQIAWYF